MQDILDRKNKAKSLFLYSLIGFLLFLFRNNIPVLFSFVTQFCMTFCLVNAFMIGGSILSMWFQEGSAVSSLLVILGRHSLEIYLFHVYLTSGLRPMIRFLHISTYSVAFIFVFLSGIIVPIIISEILRKIGLWNLIFKPIRILVNDV